MRGPEPGGEEEGPALKTGVTVSGTVFIANPICVKVEKVLVSPGESPYVCLTFVCHFLLGA